MNQQYIIIYYSEKRIMQDRDDFQGSESDIGRKQEEVLFKSIRIFIALSIYIILQLIAVRIEYQINWIIIGLIFFLCDSVIWILSSKWLYQQQYPRIAKVFLAIAQNSTLGLLPIFIILLCLQLDGIINQNPILIILPLFVWKILLLSFLIFIIPGLCDDNYGSKKWVAVIIIYYVSIIYTEIAALIQLQQHFDWFWVVSLLLFAIFYNIVTLITDCATSIIWPCTILVCFIYCLTQLTIILNQINNDQQPSKSIQYLTVMPILIISLINLIKQIIV
ncbi:unnamed protein product (macronuclear) [Paramecium tetraurelia]|uniref:Transmembrane protein n=1 Tax=Paramecium tetraurelia TaxID=5888 RepID=A0ED39_PARTE|nr:uncharacterized protein GSPATT00004075001 [Paramecium tetraurelia]CAK93206.1 unnamed protein product [Paramecium tetraurelia]|eukprot:XP_001460603.1 hypothetical protein (macronuclear) [Paramecium tetraurelia strain d4-2]